MEKIKRKIVFFDFDGVIADTFDIGFEINKQIDGKIKTKDDYRELFNGNINDWKKNSSYSEAEIKKADDEFFARWTIKMAKANVFPGIKDAVRELAKSYTLIIISSTIASPIRDFLERNGIFSYFEQFSGDRVVHSDKAERIKRTFKKYGVGPKYCVFITDTLGDMREATSCGISSIGVAWGFQKKESFRRAKPFKIVEKPKDLFFAVSDYFKTLE